MFSCGELWYNVIMPKVIVALLGFFSAVVLLSFVYFLTPSEAGPFGVLVFFTLVYLFLFCVFFYVISFVRFLLIGKERNKKMDSYYTAVFAFGPIMILLMRSFGFMNVWTIIGSIIFVILGCFLVKKRFSMLK